MFDPRDFASDPRRPADPEELAARRDHAKEREDRERGQTATGANTIPAGRSGRPSRTARIER